MKLYLVVTKDEYQLPIAVAESIRELAQMTGSRTESLATVFSHLRKRPNQKYKYLEIEVDDYDD